MTSTEPETDPDPAPRIGPGEYPFRGALGGTWRQVWARMADGQWHQARALAMEFALKPSTGASPQAIGTMLAAAHRRGVLRHERRGIHLWVRRELSEPLSAPPDAAEVPLPAVAHPRIEPPRVRRGAK